MMYQIMRLAGSLLSASADQVPNNRFCQNRNWDHSLCLPAGYSLRPTWTRALPAKVDGRASFPIHPSVSSGASASSSGFQITTGRTPDAGRFTPRMGFNTPEAFQG